MFYVKILLNFYQNCLTLLIAKIKLYVILKNDRLKSHKKGVLSFWQGIYNQLNAKTVPRTVFCQKCLTLLNFVVQVLLFSIKN